MDKEARQLIVMAIDEGFKNALLHDGLINEGQYHDQSGAYLACHHGNEQLKQTFAKLLLVFADEKTRSQWGKGFLTFVDLYAKVLWQD